MILELHDPSFLLFWLANFSVFALSSSRKLKILPFSLHLKNAFTIYRSHHPSHDIVFLYWI